MTCKGNGGVGWRGGARAQAQVQGQQTWDARAEAQGQQVWGARAQEACVWEKQPLGADQALTEFLGGPEINNVHPQACTGMCVPPKHLCFTSSPPLLHHHFPCHSTTAPNSTPWHSHLTIVARARLNWSLTMSTL